MYCRFPNFRFRPSQSDALHVDLWHKGVNILRDGGTYSYAAPKEDIDYFMGSSSHNTCRFDDRDQMPRLGRFLYGPWLKVDDVAFTSEDDRQAWQAGYADVWRCSHQRTVESTENGWTITDNVDGPFKSMTLRWRLCAEFEWLLSDQGVCSDAASIHVSSETDPNDMGLSAEHESRFYLEKQPISVLIIRYSAGVKKVVTEIIFGEKLS